MCSLSCGLFLLTLSRAAALDPQSVLELMDDALAPARYHAVMEMTTTKPDKTSVLVIDLLYRRGTGSLMELLSPNRVKGTRLLQKSGGLWLYSPASGSTKPLRLSLKQSFQGSLFSNGDVGEPHFSRDYTAVVAGHESVNVAGLGPVDALVLDGVPSNPQAQYGRIKVWVQPDSNLPLRIDYTAKSGLLFKRMTFSEYRDLAGTKRPTKYTMESFEEPGTYTVLSINEMQATPDLPENDFSETRLTR